MEEKTKSKRFVEGFTKQDLDSLMKDADSNSTKRTIERSKRLFKEFLAGKGITAKISEITPDILNSEIELFLGSIRKQDGDDMKKKSLDSIKYGLTKFLLIEHDIDLSKPEYSGIKTVYKAKVKRLKKDGKGSVEHKELIDLGDLQKLMEAECVPFNPKTPCGLQNRVWFMLMWHLIRRGQENLRNMTKATFACGVSGTGRRYVHQVVDEADKNHGGEAHPDSTIGEGKMYDDPDGGPNCPVKLFEKYLNKLNPKCDALWQRPLDTYLETSLSWYCNSAIGKNGLGTMMQNISKQGKLSKVYTNHCLRATAIKYLDEQGIEARHIKRVSGHQSIASIESYAQRLSENKREEISDILREPFRSKPVLETASTSTLETVSSASETVSSATALANVSDFDDFVDVIDLYDKENAQPITQIQYQRQEQSFRQAAPVFNITNCNVTINHGSWQGK